MVLYASASETNRLSFTEFLLQKRGKGRFVQRVGGEGIVNCGEINNNTWPDELTTLLERLKCWLYDEGECRTEWMK